jgi:hypothetical protein
MAHAMTSFLRNIICCPPSARSVDARHRGCGATLIKVSRLQNSGIGFMLLTKSGAPRKIPSVQITSGASDANASHSASNDANDATRPSGPGARPAQQSRQSTAQQDPPERLGRTSLRRRAIPPQRKPSSIF